MLRTLIAPALLFLVPSALLAARQPQTHEMVRLPAGKTVVAFREINRQQGAAIKCNPDPTKAFLCHGRAAPSQEPAAKRGAEQLSER